MAYDIDMTPIQADIEEWFNTNLIQDVYPDGMLDNQNVEKFTDGSIKPFVVVRYASVRRAPRGRSFGGTRMDSYRSGIDVIVVARSGKEARPVLNRINDLIIGHKFLNCGETVKGEAAFSDAKPILDAQNKPSRWAVTDRFDFGVFQTRSTP